VQGLQNLIAAARLFLACALASSQTACSLSSERRPFRPLTAIESPRLAPRLPETELETQRLFRVRYDGPEGDGSLRMTLRLEAADRFQITAADTLGRPVWSLQADGGGLLSLNHREQTFCRAAADLRLPETALAPLPVGSLPSVLLGYLPMPPDGSENRLPDRVDYRDGGGRRWTARSNDGNLAAWTLWDADVPILWWSRQPRGGVLSHREGVQFRWREVVREPLTESVGQLLIPSDFRQETCDETRP
jgi:hypothetical protein